MLGAIVWNLAPQFWGGTGGLESIADDRIRLAVSSCRNDFEKGFGFLSIFEGREMYFLVSQLAPDIENPISASQRKEIYIENS